MLSALFVPGTALRVRPRQRRGAQLLEVRDGPIGVVEIEHLIMLREIADGA